MTKYLRTVNFASLREDFEMPFLPVATLLQEAPAEATHAIDSLPDYCNTEVYVLHTKDDKADLCAWLPEHIVKLLRGPQENILQSWISSLDPQSCRQTPAEQWWKGEWWAKDCLSM